MIVYDERPLLACAARNALPVWMARGPIPGHRVLIGDTHQLARHWFQARGSDGYLRVHHPDAVPRVVLARHTPPESVASLRPQRVRVGVGQASRVVAILGGPGVR